ncbi:hypothetical protein [Pleomorphomonas sp. JP5]|uniref:hypothetical protein n=1 Tax=Pleomorphomonas sp. JP5 TaxID=2942998 RepID=UPI00204396F6|nr:hypothetical protein [Pleomorphomonas sp. JP5]MCM5556719.1 hypothetical protein [Pleomorphomonas sp. JP5]
MAPSSTVVSSESATASPASSCPEQEQGNGGGTLLDVTVEEVLKEIQLGGNPVPTNKPEPPEPTEGTLSDELSRERAFEALKAFKAHHENKKNWSWFMMGIIFLLIVFQIYLLRKVGTGSWDFTKYEWLLPVLLVQNFAQIIGLAHVVVRSLFDGFKE